ncbi:MAG: COX15/CtaA family protein [Betaproteobacteria bacterium]
MEQSFALGTGRAIARTDAASRKQVALWLLICCALVFAMVVVGGVTRLTHSGLSIVEWQPLVGAVPPLNAEQWDAVFQKYQQTPQYLQVNHGMSLDEFKGIFWWEYIHRLLGRAIGVVFLVPLLYFAIRGKVDVPLAGRLAGIFVLGGLQGALGWYMVKSGLINDPHVSQFRLTAHLALAFLIFAALFWTALCILAPHPSPSGPVRQLKHWAIGLSALVFFMVLSGGLVAGIRAGFAYNTFPLMNGHIVPPEYTMLEPWYQNLFYNMASVQFNHRLIAWSLFLLIPLFWFRARDVALTPRARLACNVLPAALVMQIALGISTLLLIVPLTLAAAHQAGALALFAASLWVAYELS